LRVHRNKNFTHKHTHPEKKKTETVIDRLSDPESLGLTNPALTVEGFELLRVEAEIQASGRLSLWRPPHRYETLICILSLIQHGRKQNIKYWKECC